MKASSAEEVSPVAGHGCFDLVAEAGEAARIWMMPRRDGSVERAVVKWCSVHCVGRRGVWTVDFVWETFGKEREVGELGDTGDLDPELGLGLRLWAGEGTGRGVIWYMWTSSARQEESWVASAHW